MGRSRKGKDSVMENNKLIKDATLLELEAAVAARKAEVEEAAKRPKKIVEPDFALLVEMFHAGVEKAIENGYLDDDFKQYVYEAVVSVLYGPSYWAWCSHLKKIRYR